MVVAGCQWKRFDSYVGSAVLVKLLPTPDFRCEDDRWRPPSCAMGAEGTPDILGQAPLSHLTRRVRGAAGLDVVFSCFGQRRGSTPHK